MKVHNLITGHRSTNYGAISKAMTRSFICCFSSWAQDFLWSSGFPGHTALVLLGFVCYPVRDWFSVPRPEENIFIAMKISSWSCSFPPGSHTCTYQKVRGPGLRDAWSSVVCCLSYFLCLFFKCWQKRTHTRMLWKDADTKFGSRHLPTVM